MAHCKKCGKEMTKKYDIRHGEVCQSCYIYYRDGGTDNSLPPKGRILYDTRGYVICHICGKAYKRLGSHIRESHGMTIEVYKYRCRNAITTESSYRQKARENALHNKMDEQLKRTGVNTRIKTGETKMRKGKPVRLQEILDKRDRGSKVNK